MRIASTIFNVDLPQFPFYLTKRIADMLVQNKSQLPTALIIYYYGIDNIYVLHQMRYHMINTWYTMFDRTMRNLLGMLSFAKSLSHTSYRLLAS